MTLLLFSALFVLHVGVFDARADVFVGLFVVGGVGGVDFDRGGRWSRLSRNFRFV